MGFVGVSKHVPGMLSSWMGSVIESLELGSGGLISSFADKSLSRTRRMRFFTMLIRFREVLAIV